MSTLELKNILIQKISSIDDESFLNTIRILIDKKSESTTFTTSAEQKRKIEEGIDQLENGNYFTNEQVEFEINKWLAEE